jgi:hypothetical protein
MIIYMHQTLALIEKERPDLVEKLSGNLTQVAIGDLVYYKLIENEVVT